MLLLARTAFSDAVMGSRAFASSDGVTGRVLAPSRMPRAAVTVSSGKADGTTLSQT